MASDNEASSCESDPNFAVICAFFEKFAATCGLNTIDFLDLQAMLENTQEVPQVLIDLHVKLLRKARKSVSNERWERAVIKFCHGFCSQDAWEIERFGYKKARISSKLRILKELLEMQFDFNMKFKTEINRMSADELRSQPLGRDKSGHAYWFQSDENYQIRVYKEDLDEETWTLVAKDRDGLVNLITDLNDGDSKLSSDSAANDDSNSLSEKPIIDTGQADSNTSDSKKSLEDSEDSSESKKMDIIKRDREIDVTDERDVKKFKADVIVSEAIEEPVMKVHGVGSGLDNETMNPIVGDVIEEEVFYVWGEGSGESCRTGNESNKNDTNENNDSTTNIDSINSNKSVLNDNNTVPKCPYKLGTIYDTKTDNKSTSSTVKSPTKKSRWDVESIINKETDVSGRVEDVQTDLVPKKQPMFFFGRGAFPFKSPPPTMGFGISSVNKSESVPQEASQVSKIEEKHVDSVTVDENKEVVPVQVETPLNEQTKLNEVVSETKENEKVEDVKETTPAIEESTEKSVTVSEKIESIEPVKDSDVAELKETTENLKLDEISGKIEENVQSDQNELVLTDKSPKCEVVVHETPADKQINPPIEIDVQKIDIEEKIDTILPTEITGDVKQQIVEEKTVVSPTLEAVETQIIVEKPEEKSEILIENENSEIVPKLNTQTEIRTDTTNEEIKSNEGIEAIPSISETETTPIPIEASLEVPNVPIVKEMTSNLQNDVSDKHEEEQIETPIKLETSVEAFTEKVESTQVPAVEIVCKKEIAYICDSKIAVEEPIKTPVATVNAESTLTNETEVDVAVDMSKAQNLLPEIGSVEKCVEKQHEENVDEIKKSICETVDSNLSQGIENTPNTSNDLQRVETNQETTKDLSINKIVEASQSQPKLNNEKDVKPQVKKPVSETVCLKKVAYICGKNDESNILTDTSDTRINVRPSADPLMDVQPVLIAGIKERVKSPEKIKSEINVSDINKPVPRGNSNISLAPEDLSTTKENTGVSSSKMLQIDNKLEDFETAQDLTMAKSENSDTQAKPANLATKENKVVVTIVDLVPATDDLLEKDDSIRVEMLPEKVEPQEVKEIPVEDNKSTVEVVCKVDPEKSELKTVQNENIDNCSRENTETCLPESKLMETKLTEIEKMPIKKDIECDKNEESVEEPKLSEIEANVEVKSETNITVSDLAPEKDVKIANIAPVDDATLDSSPGGSPASIVSAHYDDNESNDAPEITENKPQTAVEEEDKVNVETEVKKPLSLANFSMDFNEDAPVVLPAILTRALRKRGHESPTNEQDVEEEESAGKKMKLKAKRAIDVNLRKSIEMQKEQEISSSEEENIENAVCPTEEDGGEPKPKPKARKKGKKGKGKRRKSKPKPATTLNENEEVDPNKPIKKKTERDSASKMNRVLSNLGINPDQIDDLPQVGVRQSRRLAQLRIREQSETKRAEKPIKEEKKVKTKKSDEDKDYKAEKRKRSKKDHSVTPEEDEEVETKKSKKKKKLKDPRKLFDENKPWKSSSDSSSSMEEEEEEIEEEEEEVPLELKSDHEFSPESDIEDDGEAQPLKRARTARKESDIEEVDDCPCQKCGKSDHPEWILLCDKCDNGWHCSCLRPPLLVIPEGDWFCPPCQHIRLLECLQVKLSEYDKKLNKKTIEDRRKERLAYVGISLNNVLPSRVPEIRKKRSHHSIDHTESSSEDVEEEESGSESESNSGSQSDSDEPIYQLRQRRQAQSYKFNDYDEMIKSAIQDEMESVKGAGNQGRGKDIATIVQAEQEEPQIEAKAEQVESVLPEPKPPVVPKDDEDYVPKEERLVYSDDDEPIKPSKNKMIGRKKHRKLNSLDISSDDDADSDEDFKGTSTDSEDDDFEEEELLSDSDDYVRGNKRRKNAGPVRRSTRARVSRYDADFINDDSDSEEEEAPRRKKKRSIWDESASEESDRSWGRRKRRPNRTQTPKSTTVSKKKKSKKKKKSDDSDPDAYKRKPKIKFGGLNNSSEEEGGRRTRTRGKKTTYIDTLGSDSDDEPKKNARRIESDEDEFVLNEEEENVSEEDEIEEEVVNEDSNSEDVPVKVPKIKIKNPKPKGVVEVKKVIRKEVVEEDECSNPIEQINKNLEEMDENEMEKMMEEEEYANKQLQLVALQLEKEKKRKEREAKKLEEQSKEIEVPTKRGRKPKVVEEQLLPPIIHHEPIVSNVTALIHNDESNDELSEPPGVSLPLFTELASNEETKKRGRSTKSKKLLEESLRTSREPTPTSDNSQSSNIEIAAPPLPFAQSQPTPSVITRMLQSKPLQPANYQIGSIRPKQFATLPENEGVVVVDDGRVRTASPGARLISPNQFIRGPMAPYRMPLAYPPRGPLPPHVYHRAIDPSPSGGGPINMSDPTTLPPVGSPNKSEPTAMAPYARTLAASRFPPPTAAHSRPPLHMMMTHIGPRPSNIYVPNPNAPPFYGSYPPPPPPTAEDAYQNAPPPPPPAYLEHFPSDVSAASAGGVVGTDDSNSKTYDEEAGGGGEFGGLVSYFSSQREDDLES